jgi:argininosuccinate synthase
VSKVVLAFSAGMGTLAALHILRRRFGRNNVVTYTANLGQKSSTEGLCERATEGGAAYAHIADLRKRFITDFVWPALRAGAVCDSGYALAHALARPLIVSEVIRVAREEGADFIAHGCAGKSNDQVRFEISAAALAPDLGVLAPLREQGLLHRDEVSGYCQRHGLPTNVDECRFSITENVYGSSVQWPRAPDPFQDVPEDAYRLTAAESETPEEAVEVLVSFQQGLPSAVDGEPLGPVALVETISKIAGAHGVGRLTTLEDRLIGIKMLEVYEQPAATVLHQARQALERLVLAPDLAQFKAIVASRYAELSYQGFWFSELRESLDAFILKATEFVTGDVRVRLHRGTCRVVGVRSRYSLYSQGLAEPNVQGDEFAGQDGVQGYVKTLTQSLRQSELSKRAR